MVHACFHLNDFLLMPLATYTMNKYLFSVLKCMRLVEKSENLVMAA